MGVGLRWKIYFHTHFSFGASKKCTFRKYFHEGSEQRVSKHIWVKQARQTITSREWAEKTLKDLKMNLRGPKNSHHNKKAFPPIRLCFEDDVGRTFFSIFDAITLMVFRAAFALIKLTVMRLFFLLWWDFFNFPSSRREMKKFCRLSLANALHVCSLMEAG